MSTPIRVKQGDTLPVLITTNADLTSATTRLLARSTYATPTDLTVQLPHEVIDAAAGEVEYQPDGSLPAGSYNVELEATRGAEVFTCPSAGYLLLVVDPDLD